MTQVDISHRAIALVEVLRARWVGRLEVRRGSRGWAQLAVWVMDGKVPDLGEGD